jgi:hypothetical protein
MNLNEPAEAGHRRPVWPLFIDPPFGRVFCWAKHPMFDQLPSWAVIVGVVRLLASTLRLMRKKPTRGHKRVLRLRHWKFGRFERIRLDVIDDRRL